MIMLSVVPVIIFTSHLFTKVCIITIMMVNILSGFYYDSSSPMKKSTSRIRIAKRNKSRRKFLVPFVLSCLSMVGSSNKDGSYYAHTPDVCLA
jgi:hypothetical protein